MAATITNKYDDGSGVFSCYVDSDVTTNPHTTKPMVKIIVNKSAYDALHANAKNDIRAVTLANIIDEAYD